MNIASLTAVGASIIDTGSKALGAISSLGTGALAIGSGVSIVVTAVSVGIMHAGKMAFLEKDNYVSKDWQYTAWKVAGMGIMIAGGLLGLVSSMATGVFSGFSLAALGSVVLGPVGAKVGLIAGVIFGITSTTLVIATFVKCIKEAVSVEYGYHSQDNPIRSQNNFVEPENPLVESKKFPVTDSSDSSSSESLWTSILRGGSQRISGVVTRWSQS